MPSEQPTEEFKYWAFISYSHADSSWADWLHKGLETYKVPKHLVGKPTREGIVPKRPYPVFRDRDELPGSANLGDNLTRALRQSRYLVVVCSPKSVASQWVDQEVRIFKSLGREDRVLCLIVDGEPNATARPELGLPECFPEAVRFWVDSDRRITEIPTEPIAADARKGKDGRQNALLKVLAGILGVSFDDLKQRDAERRERRQKLIISGVSGLLIVFVGLGLQLYEQKNAAIAAQNSAEDAEKSAKKDRLDALKARDDAERARDDAKVSEKKAVEALAETQKARDDAKKSEADAIEQKKLAESARDDAKKSEVVAKNALSDAQKARDAAKISEAQALEAKKLAENREMQIRHQLAASDFSEATRLVTEAGEGKAMASLARALRSDPENSAVTARLTSLLSQRNWSLPKFEPIKLASDVKVVAFSPDGKRLLTVAGNFARLWEPATGKELAQLKHNGQINSAQFSADGKRLVTASHDTFARVWDAETGKMISEVKHGDWVLTARFSPDGKLVVSGAGGQDKTARIWEAADGKVVAEIKQDGPVLHAAFSPDGKLMATAAGTQGQVYEVTGGKAAGAALKHDGGVDWVEFSPDGKLVATASGDKTVRLWEAATGKAMFDPFKHDGWVYSAQFSGDGKWLVTASSDKTARIWEVATGKPAGAVLRHDNGVNYAEFSPNARWVLTVSEDATARVWDAATGAPVTEPLKHAAAIKAGGFTHDGQYVVTGSVDQTARVWEIAVARPLVEVLRHDGWINTVAFSQDAKFAATGSDDRTARVWDMATGRSLFDAPFKHENRVNSVNFSPDGKYLVTASEDRTARIWDLSTGKSLFADPFKHESWVNGAMFSPDGRLLVTASEDRSARLWDVTTGKQVHGDLKHDGVVKSASFSPNGELVLTASGDKTARIWSVATGKQVGPSLAHKGEVLFAQFSTDGRLVVTSSDDKTARVWEAATGKPATDPLLHDAIVPMAKFNSVNNWILTVADKTVRIWNIGTGSLVIEPLKLDAAVKYASFSPDGQLLLVVADKVARLYDAASGMPVSEPFLHEGAIRTAGFSADGRFLITGAADQTARLWPVTLPGTAPAWFGELAEAAGGYRLGDSGAAQLIRDPWKNFAAAKQGIAGSKEDAFGMWGRWYATERLNRTISPFSKVTAAEYLRRRLEDGTPAGLNEALELQPNNGLALAKLARASKDAGQAEFYSALAESYEPKNSEVLWYRAQILQQANKLEDAVAVLNRAIAVDPRNVTVFGPAGAEVSSINKEGNLSKGWLPTGWSDFNAAAPVSVTYEKLTDGPAPEVTAVRITATSPTRALAQILGPRLAGKARGRYVIEGFVRSSNKSDLTVSVRSIVDVNQKFHEQQVKSAQEWQRFQFKFSPLQDYGGEVMLTLSGGPVDLAGVVVRPE